MNFLAPLFLVGALAVGLPVLFHLIRRTSKERIPFSSLMFLMPTPPRVTKRSRIENLWLLLLRCLVICLLAAAFARPFLQKPMPVDPISNESRKVLLLVDVSASMHRDGVWASAVDMGRTVLKELKPADKVALYTFDRQLHSVVSFEQWAQLPASERVSFVEKQLSQMTPGWAAGHLGSSLLGAGELLGEEKNERSVVRRIVVISDLQEGSRLNGLQGYEWGRGIEVAVTQAKPKSTANAGMQLVMQREGETAAADAGPKVRVNNAPDSTKENFKISWLDSTSGNAVGSVDVYVPAGQSRMASTPAALPPGITRFQLTGDDADFDNTLYLIPPKVEKVKILFAGSDAENDTTRLLFYLKRAFPQGPKQPVEVVTLTNAVVAETNLYESVRLVIASGADCGPVVQKALERGKTVLLVLTSPAESGVLEKLFNLSGVVEEARQTGYSMLGQIDFQHPLFAAFSDPRFSDFTKIHYWKYRRVAVDKIPGARVPAKFENGDPAVIEASVGRGRLLVLTAGWQPSDSQLALSSKFVPLIYSMMEQETTVMTGQYFVGDEVPLDFANETSVKVRRPDGVEVTVTNGMKFSKADLPGIYTVTGAKSQQFAVNVAPEESRTAPLGVDELQRLGVPLKLSQAAVEMKSESMLQHLRAADLEERQKLWRWLIAATLAVVMIETWLSGWLTRRAAIPKEASI